MRAAAEFGRAVCALARHFNKICPGQLRPVLPARTRISITRIFVFRDITLNGAILHLDPDSSSSDLPLVPTDWSMKVMHMGRGEARQHVAIVKRGGTPVCHISMGSAVVTDKAARIALAIKAQLRIAEYLARENTGGTAFPEL